MSLKKFDDAAIGEIRGFFNPRTTVVFKKNGKIRNDAKVLASKMNMKSNLTSELNQQRNYNCYTRKYTRST